MYSVNARWKNGETLTAEKFNTRIEDNLQWLRNRNYKNVVIRNGASDLTLSTLATWRAISPSALYVDIETQGSDVMITLNCGVANAGVNGITYMDFFVKPKDKTGFFLSSLTATPLTTGLYTQQAGSSYNRCATYKFLWVDVPAEAYRITPYWYTTVGASTLNITNTLVELSAEEYGKNHDIGSYDPPSQRWGTQEFTGLLQQERMDGVINRNLDYLYRKPIVVSTLRNSTDITFTTTPTLIHTLNAPTQFGGGHGADEDYLMMVYFQGVVSNTNTVGDVVFDVRVSIGVGSFIYFSSGTSTPSGRGVAVMRSLTANHEAHLSFCAVLDFTDISFSDPFIDIRVEAYATSGTATVHLAGTTSQAWWEVYGKGQTNRNQWAGSKVWKAGGNVVEGNVDTHIVGKLTYLNEKNVSYNRYEAGVGNITTTATTFTATGIFTSLLTEGNDILTRINLVQFESNVANRIVYLDILVDDSYYLSSLTATPLTDGLCAMQQNGSLPVNMYLENILTDIDAGWHKFEIYFKSSNADATVTLWTANVPALLLVEEYCLTN